jgi:valacyclovir hydrolase
MPFADISTGARLHYEDVGSGEPVLLLHGLLGTAQLHFARLMDWLKPHYRVIGPSMRGYGQSTPKPRDFPPNFYHRDAADALALMDALGLEQAHVMGYSDGGETALVAAGMQPERFKSVAVWGAVGYCGPLMRSVMQRMYPATWITQQELDLHGIPDANAFVLGWMQSMKGMIDSGGDVSVSLAPKITAPVLMMLGDQDTLNPQEYGQVFIDKTPDGRLRMFSCGHAIHDEAWDEFQKVVGDFLQSAR